MSHLDSPVGFCEAEHTIVLTDQTQKQCALEHGCPPGRKCPLRGCFSHVSGITEAALPEAMLEAYRCIRARTGGRINKPL